MTPADLKQWRASLSLTQAQAAKALGMAEKNYQQLERGANFETGKPVEIDRRTELACAHLVEHPEKIIRDTENAY